MQAQFVDATADHVREMAPRLRQCDVDEVQAASGLAAQDALAAAVRNSWKTYAALVNDSIILIAGCATHADDETIGIPWMLASDDLEHHPRIAVQGARQRMYAFFDRHDMLINFVDNRNTKAQHWLHWLGFQIGEPQPYGVAGLPFRPFWMDKAAIPSVPRQDADLSMSQEVTPCAIPYPHPSQ